MSVIVRILICLAILCVTPLFVRAEVSLNFNAGRQVATEAASAIASCRQTLLIVTPTLTARPLQEAVIEAIGRNVNVSIIFDKSAHPPDDYTTADLFSEWNAATYLLNHESLTDFSMVIDSITVLSAPAALINAREDSSRGHWVTIKDDPQAAGQLLNSFSTLLQRSQLLPAKRLRAFMVEAPKPAEDSTTVLPPVSSKPAEILTYVGNINTQVFHKSTCYSAKKLTHDNVEKSQTRDKFLKQGFTPCKRCNP